MSVARKIRRNAKYIVPAVVALAFVLSLVLFVRADQVGTDQAGGAGSSGLPTSSGSPFASPSPSDSPKPSPSRAGGESGNGPTGLPKTLPRLTLTPAEPGGFTYVNLPTHHIVLRATSSQAIRGVGYLVPTSPDHAYGRVRNVGTSWSISTTVVGRPYYAALFVQASPSGVQITCTIEIDGRVASSQTTSGPYGRRVCIG